MRVCCGNCGDFVCDVSPMSFYDWLKSNPDNVLLCEECDPLTDSIPEVLELGKDEALIIKGNGVPDVRFYREL